MKFLRRVGPMIAVLSVACSNAAEDWDRARQADTETAYTQFLSKHESSELAQPARVRLRQLQERAAWKEAVEARTVEAVSDFLGQFPAGEYASQARELRRARAREESWTQTSIAQSIALFGKESDNAAPSDGQPARPAVSGHPEAESGASRAAPGQGASVTADGRSATPTEQPAIESPRTATDVAKPAATREEPVTSGGFRVQLGAFSSLASATAERDRIQGANGDVLTGGLTIDTPGEQGRDSYFRIFSTPVDRANAELLCNRLKSRGQACLIKAL